MPWTVSTRRATPDDAPALARLRFEFRTEIKPPAEPEEVFLPRCEAWMRPRLAEDSLWRCWVAVAAGKIVGHIWLLLMEKVPNPSGEPELYGYVTNLYVAPEYRGGPGGELLLEAAAECRRYRVDTVLLWPTPRSRSLYERHGFVVPHDILVYYL
jgi:ribosomal protein S18 acetylase RimI-like enzyme